MARHPRSPDAAGLEAVAPAAGDVVEVEVAWSEMATYRSVVLVTLPDSYDPAVSLTDVLNDADETAWLDQTDPVEDLVAVTAREIDGAMLAGMVAPERLPRPRLVRGPFGQQRVQLRSRRTDPTLRLRASHDWPWPGQPAPAALYAEQASQPWTWWVDQRGHVHTAVAQCAYCKRDRNPDGLAVLAGRDPALICAGDPDGCADAQQRRVEDLASLFADLDPRHPSAPPQEEVVVVLSVSGGDLGGWPEAGALRLSRDDVAALLAEIDQVAAHCKQDLTLLSVRRWDGRVRYTEDRDLAEAVLGDGDGEGGDWALVGPDVLARFDELACRTECDIREVTHDDVVWTGYPKHGDARFFTASLSRQALAGLLARLDGSDATAVQDPGA